MSTTNVDFNNVDKKVATRIVFNYSDKMHKQWLTAHPNTVVQSVENGYPQIPRQLFEKLIEDQPVTLTQEEQKVFEKEYADFKAEIERKKAEGIALDEIETLADLPEDKTDVVIPAKPAEPQPKEQPNKKITTLSMADLMKEFNEIKMTVDKNLKKKQ